MKIYHDLSSIQISNFTVCGLGNFDGIHRGHQRLISELLKLSHKTQYDSLILTFEPHPSKVLSSNSNPLITTFNQKKEIIESSGVDHLVLAPFTREFSRINYKDFIYDILIKKCRVKAVVIGYNYRFGFKGKGNAQNMKDICQKEGIQTVVIPPITYEDKIVSSTLIRNLIQQGKVKKAADFMGRPFVVEGSVVHGNAIGKKLGFPTANITLSNEIVLPARGVYAVMISWRGNIYKGVANFGLKPTFNGKEIRLEVHIFDFNEDVYGENLEILFIEKLRSECKFDRIDDLISQIKKDFISAKEILKAI